MGDAIILYLCKTEIPTRHRVGWSWFQKAQVYSVYFERREQVNPSGRSERWWARCAYYNSSQDMATINLTSPPALIFKKMLLFLTSNAKQPHIAPRVPRTAREKLPIDHGEWRGKQVLLSVVVKVAGLVGELRAYYFASGRQHIADAGRDGGK